MKTQLLAAGMAVAVAAGAISGGTVSGGTVSGGTVSGGAAPGGAAPTSPRTDETANQVEAPIPDIEWKPCEDEDGRCATVAVPLDYDEPAGRTTRLALAKHPANGPDARIGTLFINPGGPGESATEYLPWFVDSLPPAVLDRFDVVGVDPRGVGGSTPLRCRPAGDASPPPWEFPITKRQVDRKLRYDRLVRAGCAATANPIIDHMSTADTARDMDLIRQAVGDERLTYYGISYGSYLGATYAAMFPDRVRAMVVDGVIDPIAYATGHDPSDAKEPVTSRWDSGRGSWETLTAALAECDRVGPRRCPIAGDATHRWRRVMDRLERGPVRVGGEPLRYQDVVSTAAGALAGVGSYRQLMRFIDATYDALFGDTRARGTATYQRMRDRLAPSDELDLSQPGSICSDGVNPTNPRAWVDAGARNDRRAPWFGRLWTWRSSLCAQWPGSSADAYRGPFEAATSAPVLLVAHLHDPATPITGARTLNTLLSDSRMLTLDGWGHGALGESSCVAAHVQAYLGSGTLPAPGTVCQQDEQPFPVRP